MLPSHALIETSADRTARPGNDRRARTRHEGGQALNCGGRAALGAAGAAARAGQQVASAGRSREQTGLGRLAPPVRQVDSRRAKKTR